MIVREDSGLYVVKEHKIENTNKFREAALRYKNEGVYTTAPLGTTSFLDFWREETKRCLEGYVAPDGDFITGYHYFYLNYCPILLVREKFITDGRGHKRKVVERKREFPDFWDSDYDYFMAIEAAETEGKHLAVLKARGKGYSFKGASMLCRNFFLIRDSKSYAIASEMEYLTKDGLLTKAWDFMDFINKSTAWAKKRQKINQVAHRRASYVTIDERGHESEGGYMSEIMGVSLKNDPDKARGKRGKLILWEEGGKFPELVKAWQVAQPSVETNGVAFGLMIAFGTGGEEGSDYEGLQELFFYPEGYNILPFKNIWDDAGGKCGYFVPEYVNMYGTDAHGHQLMDDNGNTEYLHATRHALAKRDEVLKGANDRNAIDRWIAEHPFNPLEACLQLSGNIFPKEELIRQLAYIRNSESITNYKQVGDLIFDEIGNLKWVHALKPKDIIKYRLSSNDDKRGQTVIWEHPPDNPPYGLYIAACLPPGEKVLTNHGPTNVEDVTLSDRIVDIKGNLVEIKKLLRHYKEDEDIYKLKMSNTYRTTTFTKEHPIYVSSHRLDKQNIIQESLFKFDFKKAEELKKGDWVKYPNVYLQTWEEKCDNYSFREDYWWFVGLWLGDGWCHRNQISICFDKHNTTQIERFKNFVNKYYPSNIRTRSNRGSITCSFHSERLVKELTNTYGKYAQGKSIPEHIKYEENEIKKNILLGFLDSDGCIYKDSRGYLSLEYVSVNLKLLEDFQDIAFSLGLVGNLSKLRNNEEYNIEGRTGKQLEAFHLRFGHTDTVRFAEMHKFDERSKLFKIDKENIKTVRSRPKTGCFLSSDNKYIYFQIKNIVKSKYTGVVYNYETSTHTYCAYHVPTHNCDPYDHDQAATSDSLGSVFIYKRFQSFESFHDLIVAEYTGRPDTVDEFYENVRKLLLYYNAILLYENEKPGLFAYFTNKHSEHLLADQPDIITSIIKDSTVRRRKGVHMTTGIKDFAELKLRDWLNEEYEPGKKNLTKIMSEPLLEELISYNRDGNFDRVIAFMLVILFREELHTRHVKNTNEEERVKRIFREPLFVNHNIPRFINL